MPRATLLSAINPTAVDSQTGGNQATAEVTFSTDWRHPSHELTLAGTDRSEIDPAPARQFFTQPGGRFGFVAHINGCAGQGNGVGAVVIADLKQGAAAHLKHLSGLNRNCPKQQQQSG